MGRLSLFLASRLVRQVCGSPPLILDMALLRPSDRDDVAPGFPGLSEAERGTVGEERLATSIRLQASGIASIASPLLDLGFDLYLRRVLTLRVHPLQVKARSFLGPDGQFEVGVSSLHEDPQGYVVLPYIPPPDWQLSGKLWAIPIPNFVKIAQRDGNGYIFSSYLGRAVSGPENAFLVDVDKLNTEWIARIPGWKLPIRGRELEAEATEEVAMSATRALGKFGELWLASELMRVGLNNVVIAQDRLRLDCVDMILHDLKSFATAGLILHTGTIKMVGGRRIVEFRIRYKTFFTDPGLFVALLVCDRQRSLHQTAFLIPSVDVPRLIKPTVDHGDAGYMVRFRVDEVPATIKPYAVPTEKLAGVILSRVGGAIPS